MDKIKLDKSPGAKPAYQQIIASIEQQIQSGRLKPRDKIPAERDLAEELRTARGTVKRAYDELARRRLIEAAPGRGSFVAPERPAAAAAAAAAPGESRKDKALRLIDGLIDELARLKFSAGDIRIFFDLRLLGREDDLQSLNVVAVDCNPEALGIFERQFQIIPRVNLSRILVDELFEDPGGAERLRSFDLVLTTTTHHREVLERFPDLKPKVLQVAVSPTRDSIISLARLTPSQKIGVACESRKFLDIVLDHLKAFDISASSVAPLFWSELDRLDEFLAGLDAVIIPAGYSLQRGREHLAAIQAFTGRGGVIVPFDYQIERGSLLAVEERLRTLLEDEARGL
ncbi:MAG TPA: winged helix-turn-helix domain-containing protein [Candidatus Aminicenantes bacterium]|nr:winged helix-turn-helix domain-containing protein [Candidatus Aminicenantes bacterium]